MRRRQQIVGVRLTRATDALGSDNFRAAHAEILGARRSLSRALRHNINLVREAHKLNEVEASFRTRAPRAFFDALPKLFEPFPGYRPPRKVYGALLQTAEAVRNAGGFGAGPNSALITKDEWDNFVGPLALSAPQRHRINRLTSENG